MKTVLYYHTYLTDDTGVWSSIFMEQFKLMEDTGLLPVLDKVKINAISQRDKRAEVFEKLCRLYVPSSNITFIVNPYKNDYEMIHNIESPNTVTENQTMIDIWNDSQKEDMNILYVHTKGITSFIKCLQQGDVDKFRLYYYWRQYLNWGVIENWKTCLNSLNEYDIAGVNFYKTPHNHFSGNYWWTTSKHIRSLPNPATIDWWHELKRNGNTNWLRTMLDRYRDEQWPCVRSDTKIFRFNQLLETDNPIRKYLPKSDYCKTISDEIFNHDELIY